MLRRRDLRAARPLRRAHPHDKPQRASRCLRTCVPCPFDSPRRPRRVTASRDARFPAFAGTGPSRVRSLPIEGLASARAGERVAGRTRDDRGDMLDANVKL